MRLISYSRISTGDQDIDLYIEQARKFCERYGHELVREFSDPDVSGGIPFRERPDGSKAYQMLINKEVDGIISDDTARSFRDVEDGISTWNRWTEAGRAIFYGDCFGEPLDISTPAGFRNAITPLVEAHMERLKIKYRTKRAMTRMRANSKITSHLPFGFSRNEFDLVEIPEEMAAVSQIMQWHHEGFQYAKIAEMLNGLGISSKRKKGSVFGKKNPRVMSGLWSGKTVKGVILYHSQLKKAA